MRTGTSFWNKSALAVLALLSLSACGGSETRVTQADPAKVVALAPTFESLSANILQPRCASCHQVDSQERLLRALWISPGLPEQSPLFQRITLPPGTQGGMPAGGFPLAAQEVEAVRAWIAGLGSNGVILTPGGP